MIAYFLMFLLNICRSMHVVFQPLKLSVRPVVWKTALWPTKQKVKKCM